MLLALLAILGGFIVLIWSADRFVAGASSLASNLGVPPLIVGLTIVGIGTSAPEMLISGLAAGQGNAGLGIGNAVGSNIANMGLILGITALYRALDVGSRTLRREMPLMIGVTLIAYLLVADHHLGHWDGGILLFGMVVFLAWLVYTAEHTGADDPLRAELQNEITSTTMGPATAALWFLVGLVLLIASSKLLVWGAVAIAEMFGVSDLVIGLTIVAIGTSLPELATCLTAAKKGEADIAIGNIIGSNLFNLLAVLALPGLIAPGAVLPEVLNRDFPILTVITLIFALTAYGLHKHGRITRWEGGLLLLGYVGYQGLLYTTA